MPTTVAAKNQTVLEAKPPTRTGRGARIPVVVQSDTQIGICPTVEVQVLNSEGKILAERVANTEFGLDLSLDFVDCTAGVELAVPSGANPIRFRALNEEGEVLAEGGLISFSELSDPVEEGGTLPSLSGLESSLSGILFSVVGLALVFNYFTS